MKFRVVMMSGQLAHYCAPGKKKKSKYNALGGEKSKIVHYFSAGWVAEPEFVERIVDP